MSFDIFSARHDSQGTTAASRDPSPYPKKRGHAKTLQQTRVISNSPPKQTQCIPIERKTMPQTVSVVQMDQNSYGSISPLRNWTETRAQLAERESVADDGTASLLTEEDIEDKCRSEQCSWIKSAEKLKRNNQSQDFLFQFDPCNDVDKEISEEKLSPRGENLAPVARGSSPRRGNSSPVSPRGAPRNYKPYQNEELFLSNHKNPSTFLSPNISNGKPYEMKETYGQRGISRDIYHLPILSNANLQAQKINLLTKGHLEYAWETTPKPRINAAILENKILSSISDELSKFLHEDHGLDAPQDLILRLTPLIQNNTLLLNEIIARLDLRRKALQIQLLIFERQTEWTSELYHFLIKLTLTKSCHSENSRKTINLEKFLKILNKIENYSEVEVSGNWNTVTSRFILQACGDTPEESQKTLALLRKWAPSPENSILISQMLKKQIQQMTGS